MKDVMLDLETLGTRHDAMIISIGACYFNRHTGEIGRGFSANIDPKEYADKFTTDYQTIKWWFDQSDEARKLAMSEPDHIEEVLLAFRNFLENDGEEVTVWSHATFDIPILANAFKVVNVRNPIPFRNTRDIRTLMDLTNHRSELVREGTHHHALDDAKFQARYVAEAFQKINAGQQS